MRKIEAWEESSRGHYNFPGWHLQASREAILSLSFPHSPQRPELWVGCCFTFVSPFTFTLPVLGIQASLLIFRSQLSRVNCSESLSRLPIHPPPTPYHLIFLSYYHTANHRLTSLCIVFYLSETPRTSRKIWLSFVHDSTCYAWNSDWHIVGAQLKLI